jgi:arylsulfatase A
LYEGGIRVPLIIAGAGKAGTINPTPVISTDLFLTILEWASVKAPRNLDGLSIKKWLSASTPQKRGALYWHYPHYSNQGGKPGGAIRQDDWKLIEFYEDNRVELYNLKTDLGEAIDLSSQQPAKAEKMRKQLNQWRQTVGAQMMTPNPNYQK